LGPTENSFLEQSTRAGVRSTHGLHSNAGLPWFARCGRERERHGCPPFLPSNIMSGTHPTVLIRTVLVLFTNRAYADVSGHGCARAASHRTGRCLAEGARWQPSNPQIKRPATPARHRYRSCNRFMCARWPVGSLAHQPKRRPATRHRQCELRPSLSRLSLTWDATSKRHIPVRLGNTAEITFGLLSLQHCTQRLARLVPPLSRTDDESNSHRNRLCPSACQSQSSVVTHVHRRRNMSDCPTLRVPAGVHGLVRIRHARTCSYNRRGCQQSRNW
jgi:hypothetical protein